MRLTGSFFSYAYDRADVLLSYQYDYFSLVLFRPGYFWRCLCGGVRQAVRHAGRLKRRAPPTSIAAFLPLPSPFAVYMLFYRLIRKSRPTVRADVLPRVKCIVVDEVDRLVDVLSKHAPPKEVEKRKRHARPIAALLERVLQSSPDVQVKKCRFTFSVLE